MKAQLSLKKGLQNKAFKRTLKLGNRIRSQTTTNSKKNLLITTIENTNNTTITKKSPNKSKYNTIIFPRNMTNQKIKISNHITIKSKDKNLKRYITEQNHKSYNNIKTPYTELPQINCQNNINIYRKVNTFSSKNKSNNNTQINSKSKNKNKKSYLNLNEKIIFRTPLRIRKNGSNGGIFHKLNSENSKINITETNCNNKIIIENMKKEIEFLKKEKIYKNELIEKMRLQIKENKNRQRMINENKKLKKELKELKSSIKIENNKVYKDVDLFDQFKNEYINKKSKVVQLKKEKDDLINELNYKVYTNLHIRKNIEINIKSELKHKNPRNKMNIYYDMNKYIENRYISTLKKQRENFNDYTKALRTKQINEIRFLIKMIFYSNKITKDIVLNSVINNLMNFNDIINSFIQLIKTKSNTDKKLLKNYFTLICFDNKNISNNFNINNLFNEINHYFNDIENLKDNFENMNISVEKNKKIFKACKLNDKIKSGLIELNHFNIIFKAIYGNFQDNKKNKEIYDTFIIIMKNYNDLKNLDLYNLSYKNLKISKTPDKLSSLNNSIISNNIKNEEIINDNKNDNINNNINNNNENITNNNSSNNIIKVEDDTKICNDFVTDLFNDVLDAPKDNNEIDNICKDFVSNVFEDCLNRNKNSNFYEVCYDFVSDVFDDCLKRAKNESNIKICYDFVEDIFNTCLKKNQVLYKKDN